MVSYNENGKKLASIVCVVIGSDVDVRSDLKAALVACGVENIFEAGDAETALRFLLGRHIDLILVDEDLGIVTGPEFIRFVKSGKGPGKNRDTPAIVVGKAGPAAMLETIRNVGAAAYLATPVEPGKLYDTICRVIF